MATKKLKDGGPCAENETYINGRCVKMNFFNNPAGIGAIGAGLVGIGALIKKKRANKKEAKADAIQLMKDMKSVSSKSKMKVGGSVGTKKPKMAMGGTKKYGEGGPTNKTNSTPTESKPQPNTPPTGTNKLTGNPKLKNGGVKKYLTGGPTGAGDGTSRKPNTTPEDPKGYVKAKPKVAKYGTAVMRKGGAKKSC